MFFAGHGVRARSNLDFLMPIDAEVLDEKDLAVEAVLLERVVERIHDAKKLQVVILTHAAITSSRVDSIIPRIQLAALPPRRRQSWHLG